MLVTIMLQITPINAFQDNYIWALCQPDNPNCAVVDPGDADAVLRFLAQHNKQLSTILITHHHQDHTGGIQRLKQQFADINVIGPAEEQERIKGLTLLVQHGDVVNLAEFSLKLDVIGVPGHTFGHIAFYSAPVLFCGDTLFSAGCGRLFEGSPAQMWQSLQRLLQLPESTQIYCSHEYTLANIKFALTIEPENSALIAYQGDCQILRQAGLPTLPALLGREKQVNPFLRCNDSGLQHLWQKDSALELFRWLRASKDGFAG